MRVIQNNFNQNDLNKNVKSEPTLIRTTCNECDSELEITEDDAHIGWLGAAYVTCPCCGEETMVDELDGITLTVDNLEYPKHFLKVNKNIKHVKEIKESEILKSIKQGIEYFRKNKNEYIWYTAYGDMFLFIHRLEDDHEYYITVSKNFNELYLPFERKDEKYYD